MRILTARRLSLLGFVLAASLLILSGWLAYRQTLRLTEAQALLGHTLLVRELTEVTLSLLKDAETGQRGFLITGDAEYLLPYETALRLVPERLNRLRELTRDNPSQQARIARLESSIAAKLAELRETIDLRKDRGLEAAAEVVRTDRGRRVMEAIRADTASMLDEENRLSSVRAAALTVEGRMATAATVGVTALAVVLLLGATVLQMRANRHREEERAARRLSDAVAAASQESELRLRVTLASIGDAVIAADELGRVTLMNPVAQELTGWTEAEARDRPLPDVLRLVNETTRLPAEDPAARVLREGRVIGMANHTVLVARTGREIPIDDSAAPIRDPRGEIRGVVIVFRDVTERRDIERERASLLERTQETARDAQAASRAKDEFLATVSHELRTPLNSIFGWVRLMQAGTLEVADVPRALQVIERSTRTQIQLIDDLLDVSRIVAGNLRIELRPIDLAHVVADGVDTIRPSADAKGVRVALALPATPAVISGDPDRLAQVVANLLANAVRFTPAGGRIAVALERGEAGPRLRVEDTGEGIAPEFLPHVFDRFRQADASSARAHPGLGIGLAIVRHLVELHGGTVAAESGGPGRGSTFTVSLPAPRPTAAISDRGEAGASARADAERLDRLIGIHVLVVDDDPDSRDLVEFALVHAGARVTTASSASEALATLESQGVDVLISDIGMADMDGYELLRAIRERGGQLPAIALTAYAHLADRDAALRAGFALHVPKPIDPDRLALAVQHVRTR